MSQFLKRNWLSSLKKPKVWDSFDIMMSSLLYWTRSMLVTNRPSNNKFTKFVVEINLFLSQQKSWKVILTLAAWIEDCWVIIITIFISKQNVYNRVVKHKLASRAREFPKKAPMRGFWVGHYVRIDFTTDGWSTFCGQFQKVHSKKTINFHSKKLDFLTVNHSGYIVAWKG